MRVLAGALTPEAEGAYANGVTPSISNVTNASSSNGAGGATFFQGTQIVGITSKFNHIILWVRP